MTLHFFELLRHNAELSTWFGVGGRADILATPHTNEQLRDLLLAFADQNVRILGDGANLLVDDDPADPAVKAQIASDELHALSIKTVLP